MFSKIEEKNKAILLRKEGKTYSEILSVVPVAKSTLTLWLHSVALAKKQKQRITALRIAARQRGALNKRAKRLESTSEIFAQAERELGVLSKREKWLIGIILYWAEGSKQKDWNVSQSLQFTNSDPLMIKLYISWLTESLKVEYKDIIVSLAIHENNKNRLKEVISFWEKLTGISPLFSDRVYFKRHKPGSYRHNLGESYYGTVRITVRRSTNLNRKITGLVKSVCKQCQLV